MVGDYLIVNLVCQLHPSQRKARLNRLQAGFGYTDFGTEAPGPRTFSRIVAR